MGVVQVNQEYLYEYLCPLLHRSYTDYPQMGTVPYGLSCYSIPEAQAHTQRKLEVPGLFHVEKEYKTD